MKSSSRDQAEGTAKTITGKTKEVTGKVIGNPRLQSKGQAEKTEGQIQKKIGAAKKSFGK